MAPKGVQVYGTVEPEQAPSSPVAIVHVMTAAGKSHDPERERDIANLVRWGGVPPSIPGDPLTHALRAALVGVRINTVDVPSEIPWDRESSLRRHGAFWGYKCAEGSDPGESTEPLPAENIGPDPQWDSLAECEAWESDANRLVRECRHPFSAQAMNSMIDAFYSGVGGADPYSPTPGATGPDGPALSWTWHRTPGALSALFLDAIREVYGYAPDPGLWVHRLSLTPVLLTYGPHRPAGRL